MLDLYYAPLACSLASHIAIEESELPYRPHAISILDGEQKRPAYLAVNPLGKVPALVMDGTLLTENVAILHFLAEAARPSFLLPSDEFEKAQAMSFLAWCSNTVHPAFRYIVRPELLASDEAAQEAIRTQSRQAFLDHCRRIDTMLAGREWVLKSGFSVCDTYVIIFASWLLRIGVDDFTALFDTAARVAARPAAARILEREGCHHALVARLSDRFPSLQTS